MNDLSKTTVLLIKMLPNAVAMTMSFLIVYLNLFISSSRSEDTAMALAFAVMFFIAVLKFVFLHPVQPVNKNLNADNAIFWWNELLWCWFWLFNPITLFSFFNFHRIIRLKLFQCIPCDIRGGIPTAIIAAASIPLFFMGIRWVRSKSLFMRIAIRSEDVVKQAQWGIASVLLLGSISAIGFVLYFILNSVIVFVFPKTINSCDFPSYEFVLSISLILVTFIFLFARKKLMQRIFRDSKIVVDALACMAHRLRQKRTIKVKDNHGQSSR